MRMLKVWVVVLAMLAVSAPSFGYVLVYNVISRIRAVENYAGSMVGLAVRGYLIMDFNDTTGDFNEAEWLTFGTDSERTKVYTGPDDPQAEVAIYNNYQTVSMLTPDGWVIMVVGKITNKAIGLSGKKPIACTMSGNFTVDGGTVFDGDMFDGDVLTGSGSITITLNTVKTKAANGASETIDDAFLDITNVFDAADYSGV
jgi:hypothetical protein